MRLRYAAIVTIGAFALYGAMAMSAYADIAGVVSFPDATHITINMSTTAGNRGNGSFSLYKGTYPSTSTPDGGSAPQNFWGSAGVNVWTFNFSCTIDSGTQVTCPLVSGGGFLPDTPSGGAGDYWLMFTDTVYTGGSNYYYVPLHFNGSTWSATYTNGVTITSPTATTYVGNPITFAGTYNNSGTYNQIQFVLDNTTLGTSVNVLPLTIPSVNGMGLSWSVDKSLPFQGSYTLKARLYDTVNATGTAYSSIVSFGLGTTTTTSTTTQSNLPGSVLPIDCGTFDLGCYMKNAAVWLFYPTAASLNQFSQLSFSHTFPFSYAYDTVNVYNELFDSATTGTSTVSVTIGAYSFTFLSASLIEGAPYLNLLRDLMGYGIWIMAGFAIYRMVLKAFNFNV